MTVAHHIDLHVETFGPPTASTTSILLHSAGMSGKQWKKLVPMLVARGHRVIVPDLTGHGSSPPWLEPQPFSFRTDVERVTSMIRDLKPTHLIAHSYGGLIAIQAALQAPEHVRSLTLFDPVAFGTIDPAEDMEAHAELSTFESSFGTTRESREAWLAKFIDYWGGDGSWKGLREDARDEFRRVLWVLHEGVASLIKDRTPAAAYAGFTFPVLLMTAERTPRAARTVIRRLGEAIAHAQTIVVEGAGHLAPLTHAERVNRLILESGRSREGEGI